MRAYWFKDTYQIECANCGRIIRKPILEDFTWLEIFCLNQMSWRIATGRDWHCTHEYPHWYCACGVPITEVLVKEHSNADKR